MLKMASGVGRLCSVCYQPFTDECPERVPRILNCGHTYCTECLCRLERFNSVTCPTCKRPTPTGLHRHTLFASGHPLSSGVESLPRNFVLLDLLANISGSDRGLSAQGSAPTPVENGTKCLEHDEVKKVYCRNDKRLICIYCQVYGEHKGHDCVLAADAVVEQHHAIQDYLRTLQDKHDELERAYRRIEGTAVAVKAKEIETVHTVREHFEEVMAAFLQRRQALITRAKVMSAQKVKQLVQQKSAITHILTRCQNAIQGCQSALNCHDCNLFEAWADLDQNVKTVLDLSCNVEPVTMSDLVCHLPREMISLLSQHGFIRAATVEATQQVPVASSTSESNTENVDVQCLSENRAASRAQTSADGNEGDNQSLAWESAVTATAVQESLTTVPVESTSSTVTDEQIPEADSQSVDESDHGTVAADPSVTHSHEDSEASEQDSTVSDGDTERAASSDNQVIEPSLEEWVFGSQNLSLGWEGDRGSRITIERDVERWRRVIAEAQQSGESENAEFEEEVQTSEGSESAELEDLAVEQERECNYLTASSRQSFEDQLSHMLARAANIRSDCDLPDVVVRSHQQPLIQLSNGEMQEDGSSYLHHSVWGSRSGDSFELFPDPISLLFGESQNDDDEDQLREEEEDDTQDVEEYDMHMRDHLDLIDFEQEPVALQQTSLQSRSLYHPSSSLNPNGSCTDQQQLRPPSRHSHRPISQNVPQLVSEPAVRRSQSSHSSESGSQLQCGATSSSDQDEAELMENQVNQFLGSLSTNAGAASSSDFELAPESSGSDSDTHVVAQCSLTALTAAANATERHRRFARMQQGRGKGIPRPWSSRRGVPFNQYFMFDRSASSQSQRNAAAVSHEPRYLPIPVNSVCGHCPRPAKSRCCNCSRLFCDNCKRYNGIPCAHGSVEHSFTAVRRVKSKSRRPPRHAPFCNAAVQQPVHEDEEGTDSSLLSSIPVAIAGSVSVRRLTHNRLVRRDTHPRPLCHSPIRSTPAPPPHSRPRLWRCDHCTYFNDPHLGCCEACNHSRSNVQGELTCTHCTLVNPAGSQWCEACNNQLGDQEEGNESNPERDGDDYSLACAL